MSESEQIAKRIFNRTPLRIKFWVFVSKLPFLTHWQKVSIIMDKVTPWMISETLEELLQSSNKKEPSSLLNRRTKNEG